MDITIGEVLEAIVAYADEPHGDAGRAASRRLIGLANQVRAQGTEPKCLNQNEDYPELRCTRRRGHNGRHAAPKAGATW